jgi:dihydropteroate synthase
MTTFASPARLPATRIGPTTFAWGTRTFVMGIVNVTPDSFSGDGLLASADPVAAAVAQARAMVDEGADLLDIGGESTRPGHESVQPDEEVARVVPVVAAIRAVLPATPLSIDTTKAVVAEAALAAGANLLNDVWGTSPMSSPTCEPRSTAPGRPGSRPRTSWSIRGSGSARRPTTT